MNRHEKRFRIQEIEKQLIPVAESVIKLDETIRALEEGIKLIDKEVNPETYEISTAKLHRLKMRSEVVGQQYDSLVSLHTQLIPEGGGIEALLKKMNDANNNDQPESLPH